ncbi:MAG: thiamine pyrophosphate-binding protein [Thermodesulfobacteriota bacterium]
MKTAELIVSMLEEVGVDYIFGVPGGAIEDLNTALFKRRKIQPIVTKHEEGAAFMADGYARVSGKLGVCCSTAGPGASNMITGIASAYADSIPVLALTGQEATSVFGKGAIQESGAEGVNITGIFQNFTKYSGMMVTEKRAQHMVQKAVRLALSDRNRPTHLSLPADIMKRKVPNKFSCSLPTETRVFDRDGVKQAAELLLQAKRPAIIAGWGVVQSRGAAELKALAELLSIPVATSPKAKGVFPESHPLSLGVLGFAGNPVAREYIVEKDVDILLAVGTSFNEMMTSGWDKRLQPTDCLIQIDVDAKEMGKNYCASIDLVGDAQAVLREIAFAVERLHECGADRERPQAATTRQDLAAIREHHRAAARRPVRSNGYYHPQELVEDLQRSLPCNTIYFADMGNTMAWAIRHLVLDKPYSFYLSLGFSSMGYATAAPVGAKLAFPDRPMVSLVGDGAFLMNGFEVATAVNYNIPIIWVVFNNAMLGMVHHGRKLFKKPVPEGIPSDFRRVDFAKVAEGVGARGIKVDWAGGITNDLIQNILESGQPTVLDVYIDDKAVPPIHSRIATVDKHFN